MASGTAAGESGTAITSADLTAAARTVIDLWSSSGSLSAGQIAHLESVQIEVVDLPGAMLGFATWDKIMIDTNAAGFGWFVDSTLQGGGSTDIEGRMDLLSAFAHEFGHLLGESHSDEGLMGSFLSSGARTFEQLDSSHTASTAATDTFSAGDRASALRRFDGLAFDSWLSGLSAGSSGLSLGGSSALFGSYLPNFFSRGIGSGHSIFDEDSDGQLL
jgi:hypothetical protein